MMIFEEEDDRFYIDNSTMKNAGKGLFASRRINKNEFLSITGVMVKKGSTVLVQRTVMGQREMVAKLLHSRVIHN